MTPDIASADSDSDRVRTSWNDLWTVAGTVSTAWAVVIAVILAFQSGVHRWLSEHSAWLTPMLVALSLALAVILAYVCGRWRLSIARVGHVAGLRDSDQGNLKSVGGDFGYATIEAARMRESQAAVIWIVSPHLHYDIYDPDFRQTVRSNKARGAVYRYIVPRAPELEKALEVYKQVHHETDAELEAQFLQLPDSALRDFLTELAIYDAGRPEIYAAALPPVGGGHREDVIVFTRSLTRQYARNFSRIWQEEKGSPP